MPGRRSLGGVVRDAVAQDKVVFSSAACALRGRWAMPHSRLLAASDGYAMWPLVEVGSRPTSPSIWD